MVRPRAKQQRPGVAVLGLDEIVIWSRFRFWLLTIMKTL